MPGVQQQPPAHQRLMHAFQALEPDLANLHARPDPDVKAEVEQVLVGILTGHRRIDSGEGIALILESRQQACAGGKHIGGDRRGAG